MSYMHVKSLKMVFHIVSSFLQPGFCLNLLRHDHSLAGPSAAPGPGLLPAHRSPSVIRGNWMATAI